MKPFDNISIIVAMAENNAIGRDNSLLWHISADLKRFKALTSGHSVIMGRRTFLSLPRRPLPNRRNIVLTRNAEFQFEGVEVASSLQQALEMVADEQEAFVIGGAQIYEQALPMASKLYVTQVYQHYDADAFFPAIDLQLFNLESKSEMMTDVESGLTYSFIDYKRVVE